MYVATRKRSLSGWFDDLASGLSNASKAITAYKGSEPTAPPTHQTAFQKYQIPILVGATLAVGFMIGSIRKSRKG
jgi:hypothetical protein